jgi:hypothetical protein
MTAPVKFGLYFFALSSGITLVQYLVARDSMLSPTIGLVTGIGFAILFIVLSIKADRSDESGYTMAEGIKAGMITYGVGTLLSAFFLYILANMIDPTLIDDVIVFQKEIAEKTADTMAGFMGADEAAKAEMMAEINAQEFTNPYTLGKLGLGWIVGLIFPGLIIALISSAILKRN